MHASTKSTDIVDSAGATAGHPRRARGATGIAALAVACLGAVALAAQPAGATGLTPTNATTATSTTRGVDATDLVAAAVAADRALAQAQPVVEALLAHPPVVTTAASSAAGERASTAVDAYLAMRPLGAQGPLRDAEIALGVNLRTRLRALSLGIPGFVFREYPGDDVQGRDDLERLRRDLDLQRRAAAVFDRDVAALRSAALRSAPIRPAGPDSTRGLENRALFEAALGVASWDCDGLPRQPWDGAHLVMRWTGATPGVRRAVITSESLPGAASVTFLKHAGSWDTMYVDACDLRVQARD